MFCDEIGEIEQARAVRGLSAEQDDLQKTVTLIQWCH
jgi:hypothetical protein